MFARAAASSGLSTTWIETVATCAASFAHSWPRRTSSGASAARPRACSAPRASTPAAASCAAIAGSNAGAAARSTRSRFSDLHTPSRSRLASIIVSATLGAAGRETGRERRLLRRARASWTPCSAACRASAAVVSPLPRITSGSRSGSETSARAPSRSGDRTSPIASGRQSHLAERRRARRHRSPAPRPCPAPQRRCGARRRLGSSAAARRHRRRRSAAPRSSRRRHRSGYAAPRSPGRCPASTRATSRLSGGMSASSRSWGSDRRQAISIQAQPVESTCVEARPLDSKVGRVAASMMSCRTATRSAAEPERERDGLVGEPRHRCVCCRRLRPDRLQDRQRGESLRRLPGGHDAMVSSCRSGGVRVGRTLHHGHPDGPPTRPSAPSRAYSHRKVCGQLRASSSRSPS